MIKLLSVLGESQTGGKKAQMVSLYADTKSEVTASVSNFAKIFGHTYSQAEQEFLLNYYCTPQSSEVNCSSLTAMGVPQRYDTGTYIYYGIPVLDMKIRESNGSASYKKSNLQINFYCKIWNL